MTKSITLERYKERMRALHAALSQAPEGMKVPELRDVCDMARHEVLQVLENNPLFYVDRWERASNNVLARVWMAAGLTRFDDCPRPDEGGSDA